MVMPSRVALGIVIILAASLGYVSYVALQLRMLVASLPKTTCPGLRSEQVFVGVLSAAKNTQRRQAIRQTWGSDPRLAVFFMVCRPTTTRALDAIRAEASLHKDIVLLSHVLEDYYNVTYQTFEVYRSAALFGDRFKWVMKVDDDSYVRVDRLLGKLERQRPTYSFYGYVNHDFEPFREGPWAVSADEWPLGQPYPPWANGLGYVLSMDLAREIAVGGGIRRMPGAFFRLEDISTGIWIDFVAKDKGIGVQYTRDDTFERTGHCDDNTTVLHYALENTQYCMWRKNGSCCCTECHGVN